MMLLSVRFIKNSLHPNRLKFVHLAFQSENLQK